MSTNKIKVCEMMYYAYKGKNYSIHNVTTKGIVPLSNERCICCSCSRVWSRTELNQAVEVLEQINEKHAYCCNKHGQMPMNSIRLSVLVATALNQNPTLEEARTNVQKLSTQKICNICKGTGEIILFTSIKPCECQMKGK